MPFLARLKPLNTKKGHVVRCYMIAGARFYVERGWYEVDDDLAEQLRKLTQDHYDVESPELFDVVTREEAERIDKAELQREEEARATAARPATLERRAQKVKINKQPRSSRQREEDDDGGGDLTADEVRSAPPPMIDPDPDGSHIDDEDDEQEAHRIVEVGRVKTGGGSKSGAPQKRHKKR